MKDRIQIAAGIWFTVLTAMLLAPVTAKATVMVGETVTSGGVWINYSYNHDYYPRDWVYRYRMLADGMEQLRKTIFVNLRMPKILVIMPDRTFGRVPEKNSLEYKADCRIIRGDVGGTETGGIGECYEVNLNTESPSWEGVVKLIMSLQEFDRSQKLTTEKLEDLAGGRKAEYEVLVSEGKTGFKNYYNPAWSPDSRYVSALYWQAGRAGVEVLENGQVVAETAVTGFPAHTPVWMDNGKYLVWAGLDEVGWWSRDIGEFRNIKYEANNLEVLLQFDARSGHFNLATDTGVMANYIVFSVNPASGQITKFPESFATSDLGWDEDKGILRLYGEDRIVSPDVQKTLVFVEQEGAMNDRIEIEMTGETVGGVEKAADKTETVIFQPGVKNGSGTDWRVWAAGAGMGVAGFGAGLAAGRRKKREDGLNIKTN